MRCILLNPGPVSLSDAVRKAAVASDLSHREPEYSKLQGRVLEGLLGVYSCNSDEWAAVLLGGSGTAALESMISSLLPSEASLLGIENGARGEHARRIAGIHGIPCESLSFGWQEAVDYGRLDEKLEEGGFSHLLAAHHETSSGRLNNARRLAESCERHGVQLLLDATSSFGAEDIPFDSPALAACSATANECLHGIPGLCFVISRQAVLASAVEPPRSLYLHLPSWKLQQDTGESPFTPPVNAVAALEKALEELKRYGSWRGRQARYVELSWQVRQALTGAGVEPLLDESESSCALNAFRVPEGRTYQEVHDGLKRWGFVIDTGRGGLDSEVFCISTLGDITHYDIERLLAAIESVFGR